MGGKERKRNEMKQNERNGKKKHGLCRTSQTFTFSTVRSLTSIHGSKHTSNSNAMPLEDCGITIWTCCKQHLQYFCFSNIIPSQSRPTRMEPLGNKTKMGGSIHLGEPWDFQKYSIKNLKNHKRAETLFKKVPFQEHHFKVHPFLLSQLIPEGRPSGVLQRATVSRLSKWLIWGGKLNGSCVDLLQYPDKGHE